MSVFSKILEPLSKTINKELDKSASKEAGKNLAKPSVKSDIMPSENPRARGQMQDNIIKEFGTNYAEFKGKGQEAIKHLLEVKNGQVQGAFYRDDLGEITLAWGKVTNADKHEGYGLAHILDKRTSESNQQNALDFIAQMPTIIKNAQLKQDDKGRIKLEYKNAIVGIKNNWKGKPTNHWIVTSYEVKKEAKGGSGSLYTSPHNDIGEILPKTPLGNSSTNPTKKQESTTLIDDKLPPMMRE